MSDRLQDEAELRDLIHRYAFGLDTENWELWRSIFTDEVIIDMTDWAGGGPTPPPLPAEKHVRAAARLFEHFDATQHFMGSHRYEINGDHAVITAHMRAEHWMSAAAAEGVSGPTADGDRYTMFGTYTDRCVRTSDGWKIEHVKLSKIRAEGNANIMALASRRPPRPISSTDNDTDGKEATA